ncbi:MAG TPA: anti-sigma factor antagonist [Phycisphaerales bacterium]|nr:anti-sigma factor antagonist [Phycisphaerales bacterium]
MQIEVQQQAAVSVLCPRGPLLTEDVETLRESVRSAVVESRGRVVLDVSRIPFVDSKGLELISELGTEFADAGRVLKLAGPDDTMREVLALTEVGAVCEQFGDVTTAVRSFS